MQNKSLFRWSISTILFGCFMLISCSREGSNIEKNIKDRLISDGEVNINNYKSISIKEKELLTDSSEIENCYRIMYNKPVSIDFSKSVDDILPPFSDKYYSVYHEYENEGYVKKSVFFLDSADHVLFYEMLQ